MILNTRGLAVDGGWGRAKGGGGSSGWSLFLRGDGFLAGAAEVLSGTGVWNGLLGDVGDILGKCIRLFVLDMSEVEGLMMDPVSRGWVLEVLSVVGVLGGV